MEELLFLFLSWQELICSHTATTQLFTILTTASPSTKEFSPSPTVTLNPIVTQSPGMVGGVNVAAAVAIPVVLVISIVVVVVVIVAVFLYKSM